MGIQSDSDPPKYPLSMQMYILLTARKKHASY